jgi:predicted small secreted protein
MTIRHRFRLIPVALAAVALSLTACGGDSGDGGGVATLAGDTASATPSAAASGDLEKQLNDYVECLRKQGLDVPDPSVNADGQVTFGRGAGGGQNFDRDKFADAQKVCGDLPEGLTTPLDNIDQSQLQDTLLKFAQCMRGEGIDMPDPDMSKLGSGGNPFGSLDRDDPKVAAATEVCQKVFAESGLMPGGS